jgi:hypothetical protein
MSDETTTTKEAAMPFTVTPSNSFANHSYDAVQAHLTAAFDLVCDPTDWRAPIDATVSGDMDLSLLAEAIIHFTGTVPTFDGTPGGYRVWAEGYRMGPCGP